MFFFRRLTERVKKLGKGKSKAIKVSPPAPPSKTSSKRSSTSRKVSVYQEV